MRRKLIFSLMLGMAVLFAADVNAQTRKKTGATITGTVLDSNGKPVANASVTCETSSGMKPRAVHTDKSGKFFITGLSPDGSVYITVDHGDVDVYAIDLKLR